MKRLNNVSELKDRRIDLRKNQTSQEELLWLNLRMRKLGFKFKRQHSVGPYILDFYCPERRLAIEIDGSQHLDNKEYDKERSDYLFDLGIRTLRFWNREVSANMAEVLKKIVEELQNPPPPCKGGGVRRTEGVNI